MTGYRQQHTHTENAENAENLVKNLKANRLYLPEGVTFLGSVNAWGTFPVKKWRRLARNDNDRQKYYRKISNWWYFSVFALPSVPALVVIAGFLLLCLGGCFLFALCLLIHCIVSLAISMLPQWRCFEDMRDWMFELEDVFSFVDELGLI